MKRKVGQLLCVAFLLLPLASCSFLSGPDYDLVVTIEAGVTGNPASGVYPYKELTEVEYKYTPVNSLHTVEVLLDGSKAMADSSLTIYHSTTLVARLIDIRDTWDVTSYDSDQNKTTFQITFSGADLLGGTFSDSRGYGGTWTGASDTLVITYSDWEAYIYSGTLFDMKGSWANGENEGTWTASRAE